MGASGCLMLCGPDVVSGDLVPVGAIVIALEHGPQRHGPLEHKVFYFMCMICYSEGYICGNLYGLDRIVSLSCNNTIGNCK